MSPARRMLLAPALLLSLAACQESLVAPAPPSSPDAAPLFAAGGNSAAAQACQNGGYLALFRSDGTTFRNTGECVSYAARGGTLAHQVTATFSDVLFSACNALSWGYELDGTATAVESKPYGCFNQSGAEVTVTHLSTQTLRVYLRDDTCGHTYLEDGNHAAVTGSDPQLIRFVDSGGFCERGPSYTWTPTGDQLGNFNVTRSID